MTKTSKQLTCLTTRPEHQSHHLIRMLKNAGISAFSFPTIDIKPLTQDQTKLNHTVSEADIIIFVSANAIIPNLHIDKSIDVFSIGEGTQKQLAMQNIKSLIPENKAYNSEGLLEHPLLRSVSNKNVVIFSGKGGKNLLQKTLKTRGAKKVTKLEVYERIKPDINITQFLEAKPDIIVITSKEGLSNLCEVASTHHQAWLSNQQLLVVSQSTADFALSLGFKQAPIISANATEASIMETIIAWQRRQS